MMQHVPVAVLDVLCIDGTKSATMPILHCRRDCYLTAHIVVLLVICIIHLQICAPSIRARYVDHEGGIVCWSWKWFRYDCSLHCAPAMSLCVCTAHCPGHHEVLTLS